MKSVFACQSDFAFGASSALHLRCAPRALLNTQEPQFATRSSEHLTHICADMSHVTRRREDVFQKQAKNSRLVKCFQISLFAFASSQNQNAPGEFASQVRVGIEHSPSLKLTATHVMCLQVRNSQSSPNKTPRAKRLSVRALWTVFAFLVRNSRKLRKQSRAASVLELFENVELGQSDANTELAAVQIRFAIRSAAGERVT